MYFEKQQAALCGVHCCNNLLQGPYCDSQLLAKIARDLDKQEKALGLDVGFSFSSGSHNVDATGNFSIAVLETALQQFQLTLNQSRDTVDKVVKSIGQGSQDTGLGFVLHLHGHWFGVRNSLTRVDPRSRFFILDSLKKEPQEVTTTDLHLFLLQMVEEGWSILLIQGKFPEKVPLTQDMGMPHNWVYIDQDKHNAEVVAFTGKGNTLSGTTPMSEEDMLNKAIALSMQDFSASKRNKQLEEEPEPGTPTSFSLRVVLFDGSKKQRRFGGKTTTTDLLVWVETLVGTSSFYLLGPHLPQELKKVSFSSPEVDLSKYSSAQLMCKRE